MRFRTTNQSVPQLSDRHSIHSDDHLDLIKHQLLKEPDWAAISAARPLEIIFPSVEETKRFGKRRKLTDKDRERLSAAHVARPLTGLYQICQGGRKASLEEDTSLDSIKIRINGRLAGLHSDPSERLMTNHSSSQTMLLDYQDPLDSHSLADDGEVGTLEDPRKHINACLSVQSGHSRAPAGLEIPEISHDDTHLLNYSGSVKHTSAQPPDPGLFLASDSPHHTCGRSDQKATQSSVHRDAVESSLCSKRRFTIDEQLLDEQMSLALNPVSIRRPSREHSCGLEGTPAPSPTLVVENAFSNCEALSWLPQPQRPKNTRNPQLRDSYSTKLPGLVSREPARLSVLRPSLDPPEEAWPTPVKIFGQSFRFIDRNDADYV